ncbi:hypothetical protein PINS_up004985 [Pythium insidiosum]|nr:hypothetical protein PINS_up004985 [Pythium insidiosum]
MEPVSPTTKSRGIMMTLSPGEEYENYQKVNAANRQQMFDPNLLAAEEASRIDEEEREDARVADAGQPSGERDQAPESGSRHATGEKTEPDTSAKEATGTGVGSRATATALRKKAIVDGSTLALVAGQPVLDHKMLQASPTLRRLVNHQSFRAQAIAALRNSTKMIHPHGSFRLCWDVLSIIFIFYNAIVLPVG